MNPQYIWALHLGALCSNLRKLWYIQGEVAFDELSDFIRSNDYIEVLDVLGYTGPVCTTFSLKQGNYQDIFVKLTSTEETIEYSRKTFHEDIGRLLRYTGSFREILQDDKDETSPVSSVFRIMAMVDDESVDLMTYRCLNSERDMCRKHANELVSDWTSLFKHVMFFVNEETTLNVPRIINELRNREILTSDEFTEAFNEAWNHQFFSNDFPLLYTTNPFSLGLLYAMLVFSEKDLVDKYIEKNYFSLSTHTENMKKLSDIFERNFYQEGSFVEGVVYFVNVYLKNDPIKEYLPKKQRKKYETRLIELLENLNRALEP